LDEIAGRLIGIGASLDARGLGLRPLGD